MTTNVDIEPSDQPPASGPGVCYRHPETETGLRCNRCNKLICAKCANQSPVGFRCPDCILDVKERYYANVKGFVNPYEQPLDQPFFTYLLIGLIVAVWALMEAAGGSESNEVLITFGANLGFLILQGQVWRFFTSMFLHIGFQHLIFNSIGLLIFGLEMERLYGQVRFVIIYLLAGLFGSLASLAASGPAQFSAGASGAIFGVIGMNLAFFVYYRQKMGKYSQQQIQRVVWIVVISVVFGAFMPIDQWAHMGGLVAGFILGYGLAPRYQLSKSEDVRGLVDFGGLRWRWWIVLGSLFVLFCGTVQTFTFYWGGWQWVNFVSLFG